MEVDWKRQIDAAMPKKTYFIQRPFRNRSTESGNVPSAAIRNTRYFIAQSRLSRVRVVTRDETRLMSCAVGSSLRTNTLYSERLSFGT